MKTVALIVLTIFGATALVCLSILAFALGILLFKKPRGNEPEVRKSFYHRRSE